MFVASKTSAVSVLVAGIFGSCVDAKKHGDVICMDFFGRAVPSFARERNRSVFYDALSVKTTLDEYADINRDAVVRETHERLTRSLLSFLGDPDCGESATAACDLAEELEGCLRDLFVFLSRASVTETPGATSHDLATRYLGLSSRLTETEKTDYMMTWARGRNVPVERFVRA